MYRPVIKGWIAATLGKGSPATRWAAKGIKENPEVGHYDPRRVGHVICERYPFLRKPAQAVARTAGLYKLDHLGPPDHPSACCSISSWPSKQRP
jgi:hypothetical protein